ncbi:MAG: cation transporter [Nitrospirae bacterium]|nr:cation transporter [Nitrospirota bacterium]
MMSRREHRHGHDHAHGVMDPLLLSTRRGIWAIRWSFLILLGTALFQSAIVALSGSVALLADTFHNLGDAVTALPLWLAFALARRVPNERFTYGYGRMEDVAGVVIVLTILLSAVLAGYESLDRLLRPQPVSHLGSVVVAALVGFVGNEAVARLRISVGEEIGSAALVADGHHARVDGLTSLAVVFSAAGAWLEFSPADPLVGLAITVAILRIVWISGRTTVLRLLDAVDPAVVHEIREAARQTRGVAQVTEVRVRWLGHLLHAELNIAVSPGLTVEQGHEIAMDVRHTLLHQLRYLSNATIHTDPVSASGEAHHRIAAHAHGELPTHPH